MRQPIFLAFFAAFFFLANALFGQQTIINLPSADQTPKGKFFALHESQVRAWQPGQYWATTNFFTYGVSDEFELCLTQYQLGLPAQPYAAVGVGYKYTTPSFAFLPEHLELKLTLGQMLTFSATGKGVGVWSYALGSFRVPLLETRLAAGVSFGPRASFGTTGQIGFLGVSTVHFVCSFEQPLTEHINLLGEWFSGDNHENAYFIPGINYHSKDIILILGYKIANTREGQISNGFVLEIGRFF